jgi:hypothetical protein
MKLSEYIKGLTEFMSENGDMDVYYASDDEGNSYTRVGYSGSKFYLHPDDKKYRVDCVYQEEDMAGYGAEASDFVPICVVN